MRSVLADREIRRTAALQDRYWPPVEVFSGVSRGLARFLELPIVRQREYLAAKRGDREEHGSILHCNLAEIYAYLFGYQDSPCGVPTDDDLEIKLQRAKIVLERELLDMWLEPAPVPGGAATQEAAASRLSHLVAQNTGVTHDLFDFLAEEATPRAIETFIRCEVIRNEVVDDEVSMLVTGLQGQLKAVAAANLWDECGRGRVARFHTFWLRRLLEQTGGWEQLLAYRSHQFPWFARITSNLNAMLLTRPSYKLMAYGCFLVFESWVEPHFRRILRAMDRVGIEHEDVRLYFTAHVRIDPRHSHQLLDGVRNQRPALSPDELTQILTGAHLAVAAGTAQFDRMLPYVRSLS